MTRTGSAGKSRYGHTAKSAKTMARGVQKFVYSDGECLQVHRPQTTPSRTAMHKEQMSASRVGHEGDVYKNMHRMSRTASPDRDYGVGVAQETTSPSHTSPPHVSMAEWTYQVRALKESHPLHVHRL